MIAIMQDDREIGDRADLSGNGVSQVWRDGLWIYKRQPKYLTDNEIWCYEQMMPTGYVPFAEQIDIELIRIRYVERNDVVIDRVGFIGHTVKILRAMRKVGIRHGDLTLPHVIPAGAEERPYIIDWAESRVGCDPRSDKRREGDAYWLKKTMMELCYGSA